MEYTLVLNTNITSRVWVTFGRGGRRPSRSNTQSSTISTGTVMEVRKLEIRGKTIMLYVASIRGDLSYCIKNLDIYS